MTERENNVVFFVLIIIKCIKSCSDTEYMLQFVMANDFKP